MKHTFPCDAIGLLSGIIEKKHITELESSSIREIISPILMQIIDHMNGGRRIPPQQWDRLFGDTPSMMEQVSRLVEILTALPEREGGQGMGNGGSSITPDDIAILNQWLEATKKA